MSRVGRTWRRVGYRDTPFLRAASQTQESSVFSYQVEIQIAKISNLPFSSRLDHILVKRCMRLGAVTEFGRAKE